MINNDILKLAKNCIEDKKGRNVQILDVSSISCETDYFIIASCDNKLQLKAISEEIVFKLEEAGLKLRHQEGRSNSEWILIDFNELVIHLFEKDTRAFFNLERIWSDAKVLDL